MGGLNLGIAAGGFAKSARDVYETLSEEESRKAREQAMREELAIRKNADARAQAAADRETADYEGQVEFYGERSGAPVAGATVAGAPAVGAIPTPGAARVARPAPGGMTPPMVVGGSPAPEVAAPRATGLPAPRRSLGYYKAQEEARKSAEESAVRQANIRQSDAAVRASDASVRASDAAVARQKQALAMGDFEFASKLAQQSVSNIGLALEGLKGMDDAMPLNDPKIGKQAESLVQSFVKTHDLLPDGATSKAVRNDNGSYTMFVYDEKTGRPTGESVTFGTLGELRRSAYSLGQQLTPDMLAKMQLAKEASDVMSGDVADKKKVAELYKVVLAGAEKADTDPQAYNDAIQAASQLEGMVPDAVVGKLEQETDDGRKITVPYNRLQHMLKSARTPDVIEIKGDGPPIPLSAQQFVEMDASNIMKLVQKGTSADQISNFLRSKALQAGFSEKAFKVHIEPRLMELLRPPQAPAWSRGAPLDSLF